MAKSVLEVQVGESGRLVIPAQLRNQLSLQTGDRLVAHVEQNRLIFEKAETVKERIHQRFAHLRGKGIVEELIADRRLAAQEESCQ